ncbi:UDP-N-acetylglucosamine diphosphorylase/glucosamine-1-phosphate N-acetyltransferase [Denitratisoma sp. DHT3]|uniref:bifunctional UDP-N-acetylglucosamine diphosphorylase/glucosamine-1-phosphate N-acetyltransferase GlmU n=1 Tax=Denitratisoma sp. DHT3 TaxID=1981880 RepID=UPI001198B92D|nr:bifunctional UDP-N-acetylglucosamine diphosphorylase/glucosamine-1-phosphate N-acetyltransferase GlmU [Denitratisoma sp. DHT3]QDX79925.1 UDP-N-acetylglucosamine diphosphorylase/glucosamine-1-phosphate N-acetyltransferase [Denitratisoma sp. DHT3]
MSSLTPPSFNVVVLAAGQGKRMYSDLPKVLHPIAGRPMLAHVLDTARSLGAASICVVHGHGGEAVPAAMAAPDLRWALQSPQLGTGHAVLQALPRLDPSCPTLVLYGDVPLIRAETLRALLAAAGSDALALLTIELADPHGYGRIVRVDGAVSRIVEEKDADDAERAIRETNTGILVAPTAALARWLPGLGNRNAQGEYYLTDIVALAVAEGMPVRTAQPGAEWEVRGVNNKVQLAALERIHQRNLAVRLLDAGVTLADPERIDVRGELLCGRDVSIDVGCVFEGRVELADGVAVGPHCVLKNTTVGAGTRIQAFCHLEDAVVGADNAIGPYARLRPGAALGREVHIGNFVEVKNSTIADHSKANHLAYLGDATVGQRVNIGAGTITCNYDGANKHRTVIEDDAFIGSDTQLVAPVTVGRGATLGAGTTLTRDAPAEQLTVSRPKQISIAAWKRPIKRS